MVVVERTCTPRSVAARSAENRNGDMTGPLGAEEQGGGGLAAGVGAGAAPASLRPASSRLMPEWVAYLELARLFRWRRMVSAISVFRSGAVGMYDMATLQGRRNGGGGAGLDTAAAGAGGAFDRRRGGLWSYQSPK